MDDHQPRSIFIIGAQCTGKTTLVNALRRHFAETSAQPPAIISKVARTVLKQLDITRDDIVNSAERCLMLQKAILLAQFEAERRLADGGQWYMSDRSALDPVVYAKLFVSETAARALVSLPQWTALEQNMKRGLVFLCESGCNWLVDDGTRLMPKDDDDWARVDAAFRALLEEREIAYVLVQKDLAVAVRVALIASQCTAGA